MTEQDPNDEFSSLGGDFTQFLLPTLSSLRDSEKYRVEQQLMDLSFKTEGVFQACTKFVRLYPIYPSLIAIAFSHASLCLGDQSVVAELKDNLEKLAQGSTTPLLWLIKHSEIKALLVDVINIEPRSLDHAHSCLLTKVPDWRTITKADIVCLGVQVAVVLRDHVQVQVLLRLRDQEAQTLLDLLQALLSYSKIDPNMQSTFLHALIKLATKSGRFPQCLKLRSLTWESEPFSGGGFAEVYKGSAKNRSDTPLAIKVIRIYLSKKDRLLKSFSSEAVVWSHLRHPNVLPFYGVFQEGDTKLCLVSPYLENGNIRSYIQQNSKDVNRALLALDAARGLEFLHTHNPKIIHADIKGVNVLISDSGRACLADFGFATAKDTQQAHVPSTMLPTLSFAWSPPEILQDFDQPGHQAHTVSSDMYSFGCLCYEIFYDRNPFHGVQTAKIIFMVISGKRPERPERGMAPHLTDEEIWPFMTQCWLEAPGERPLASDAVRLFERLAAGSALGVVSGLQAANEWDYSILEEILAETAHPFSMLLNI